MDNQTLKTRVELFMSARKLKNIGTFSKSDPYCVISIYDPISDTYIGTYRTEVINNNLNPDWQTTAILDYYFELNQNIRFTVYDDDSDQSGLIGTFDTTLGYIVGKGTTIENINTTDGHRAGKLIIRAEEKRESRDAIWMQLCAHHIDKKDFFGKSDPYLIFYRAGDDATWLKVHKTETIKNTLDPIWKPIEILTQKLCNCDELKPLKIECWDWDRNSSDEFIGSVETTLHELLNQVKTLDLINPEKRSKKKYKNSGILEVQHISVKTAYSFIDYLRGGTQLSLSVAIDFSLSNGKYTDPESLHYLSQNTQNDYERAILAVGWILDNYIPNKEYSVFGFGGQINRNDYWEHFLLNKNQKNPRVSGIPGVIGSYYETLSQVIQCPEGKFGWVISDVSKVAQSTPKGEFYHVLLILTNGQLEEIRTETFHIVGASSSPLSIIIVGIGNEDFSKMKKLDSDGALLIDWNNNQAVRDTVQFVPFRKFEGNPNFLAQEVLAELPRQITEYMRSIEHIPIIPKSAPMDQLQVHKTHRTAEPDPEAQYINQQTDSYSYPQAMPPQGIIPQPSNYQSMPPQEIISQQHQYQNLSSKIDADPCAATEDEIP